MFRIPLNLIIFGLLHVIPLCGQSDRFQTGYGGAGSDGFNELVVCPSGGFACLGSTESFGAGGYDFFLYRCDDNGDMIWSKTIGTAGDDFGTCMVQLADGGFVLGGYTSGYCAPGLGDAFFVRTDSQGNVVWTKTVTDSTYLRINDLTLGADSSLLFTGTCQWNPNQTPERLALISLNLTGNVQWFRKIIVNGSVTCAGEAIQVLPGGGFIIAGMQDPTASPNPMLIRVNSSGSVSWARVVSGTGIDMLYDVCISGATCAAVGSTGSWGSGAYDVVLMLADTNGTHKRTRVLGTIQTDYAYAIEADSDGGFLIAGMTRGFSNNQFDPFILKTDSLGNQKWLSVLGTAYPDAFYDLAIASSNRIALCGNSNGLGIVGNQCAMLATVDTLGGSDCYSFSFSFDEDSVPPFISRPTTFSLAIFNETFRNISSVPIAQLETNPLCMTAIDDVELAEEPDIYPQPASSVTSIHLNSNSGTISVWSSTGQKVYESNCDSEILELNVSEWPCGIYYLQSSGNSGHIVQRKIVVAR